MDLFEGLWLWSRNPVLPRRIDTLLEVLTLPTTANSIPHSFQVFHTFDRSSADRPSGPSRYEPAVIRSCAGSV